MQRKLSGNTYIMVTSGNEYRMGRLREGRVSPSVYFCIIFFIANVYLYITFVTLISHSRKLYFYKLIFYFKKYSTLGG